MAAYEITVSLRAKDFFYSENNAASSVSGHFNTFSEALPVFCEAVAFGFQVNTEKLSEILCRYGKKAVDVEKSYSLRLVRHDIGTDMTVLENTRSDSDDEGESTVVSCSGLNEEELGTLATHGIEPEEDSFGTYFEVYPVYDLLYDISDVADGMLDPMNEDLKALVQEYAHRHGLITNEIDPAEDGYFCYGNHSTAECFHQWGKVYGYTDEEQDIFTDALVPYEHGYVMELRD